MRQGRLHVLCSTKGCCKDILLTKKELEMLDSFQFIFRILIIVDNPASYNPGILIWQYIFFCNFCNFILAEICIFRSPGRIPCKARRRARSTLQSILVPPPFRSFPSPLHRWTSHRVLVEGTERGEVDSPVSAVH